jgi:hypothetical protein
LKFHNAYFVLVCLRLIRRPHSLLPRTGDITHSAQSYKKNLTFPNFRARIMHFNAFFLIIGKNRATIPHKSVDKSAADAKVQKTNAVRLVHVFGRFK